MRHFAGKLEVDQFQKLNGINGLEKQRRKLARGKEMDSVLDVVDRHP